METNIRTTQFTICQKEKPIGDETCTKITLIDESDALWIEIFQPFEGEGNTIKIDIDDWPMIKQCMDKLIKEYHDNKKGKD